MTSSSFAFLRSFAVAPAFTALALAVVACDVDNSTTNPRPSCPPNSPTPCGVVTTGGGSVSTGGGGGGGGGEGGSGGSVASNDVQGDLGVLNDPGFSIVSPYLGDATIITTSTTSMQIEAPYGASASSFDLQSVMSGPTWFYVQDDTSGATGIWSTHSVVNIPVSSAVRLPVVDRNIVTSIAATLPSPVVVDTSKSLLILKVTRNGQPLSGVALTTSFPGATIVYDTGVGLYSNQVNQTGPAGVILVLNIDGPAAAELRDLVVTDSLGQAFYIQTRVQAAAATFAGYTL